MNDFIFRGARLIELDSADFRGGPLFSDAKTKMLLGQWAGKSHSALASVNS